MPDTQLGFWSETIKAISSVWEFFAALVATIIAAVGGWIRLRSQVRQHAADIAAIRKIMTQQEQYFKNELMRLEQDRGSIVESMLLKIDKLSSGQQLLHDTQLSIADEIIRKLIALGLIDDPRNRRGGG